MTKTALAKILVFDSGVGGLSILQALQDALPACQYIYASDNQAFPYGTKSADFLSRRVQAVLQALIKKTQPDLIVIACNTASTLVLSQIRCHFRIPIVGVVPAIKPAAEQSKTGVIGLLGTPGTVTRTYTKDLIDQFAGHCEVVSVGSSALVEFAEATLRNIPLPPERLCAILKPFFEHTELDTIVLACTHFPLIKKQLIAAAPRNIDWVDSGDAIARRVTTLLQEPFFTTSLPKSHGKHHTHTAIFTAQSHDIGPLESALERFGLSQLEYLSDEIFH